MDRLQRLGFVLLRTRPRREAAGQQVRFWIDTTTVHLSIDGWRIKTVPSRLSAVDIARLRQAGARPAGPPPSGPAPGALAATSCVEVQRLVNASGIITLGNQVKQALATRQDQLSAIEVRCGVRLPGRPEVGAELRRLEAAVAGVPSHVTPAALLRILRTATSQVKALGNSWEDR